MNTTEIGRKAEAMAASFLQIKGCRIIGQNWQTRQCEIDIVAERQGVVYFCEVKYRLRTLQGSGIEYITPAKLRRMQFAAESWVQVHRWQGDYQLCAIEVSGPEFRITRVIKDITV